MKTKSHVQVDTGIIVPCYNESERIQFTEFDQFLSSNNSICFCFVNDGSTDGTQQILENFTNKNSERCQVINLPTNQGKAEAVRQGITTLLQSSQFQFVGYWDADLATPLAAIPEFIELIQGNKELVAVFGSRISRFGASIHRSVFRHYFGRVFATIASFILDLPVYDTQCGAKLFRTDHAKLIFTEPFLSRWFFDVELFARSILFLGRKKILRSIYEFPLSEWHDQGESKVTWCNMFNTPFELFRIYKHYRICLTNP